MTVQMIRGTEVTRPTPDRLTSTLLDHATVKTVQNFGLSNNAGLWPSYNCLDLLTPTVACPDPMVGSKVFTRAGWVPAFEFAVYGGVECSAIGLDKADQERETKRVFGLSEGKGVEQALLYTRLTDVPDAPGGSAPLDPTYATWDEPTDLTPGAAVSVLVALALLEGDAASKYAGLPTIHMPRAAATILSANGLIVWKGDKAYTQNGSKVAMGGGYDDPTMLASGLWDMYATGEVYVEMSDQIDHTLYVIPGMADDSSDGNGLSENTVISFAERMYRVGIDCYSAKATGKAF